jgi:hypothetical protein
MITIFALVVTFLSIELLIWRERKATAFNSLITDLSRAVALAYRDTIEMRDPPILPDTYVIEDNDLKKLFGSAECIRLLLRQAAYVLRAHNELVDIAYAREMFNGPGQASARWVIDRFER